MKKLQDLRNFVLMGMEHNNWLPANIMNATTLAMFEYTFPRTSSFATFNLAVQIAAGVHDKEIQGNKYHLFSMPLNFEKNLRGNTAIMPSSDFMAMLENIAADISVSCKEGPVLIGSLADLNDDDIIRAIAKHYLEAFRNSYKTYPYIS